MSRNARVTIERLAKKYGGIIAGPDDPIYQEGYQVSFTKNSRRPSTSISDEGLSEPTPQELPDQEASSLPGSDPQDTTTR